MKINRIIKRKLIKQALTRPAIRKFVARRLARRMLKPLPLIGASAIAVLTIGTLRRKGALRGSADVALDLTPGVGVTKAIVEVFTGDLIPDKPKYS
jgi:hypothetical protein